jgi:hypothetical protein
MVFYTNFKIDSITSQIELITSQTYSPMAVFSKVPKIKKLIDNKTVTVIH